MVKGEVGGNGVAKIWKPGHVARLLKWDLGHEGKAASSAGCVAEQ